MTEPFRLLLIDANTPWLAGSGRGRVRQVVLPLGLMYLSAAAKRAFGDGVAVKVINTAIDCEGAAGLEDAVRAFAPHVVGFRALSMASDFLGRAAEAARRAAPAAVLVAGGPYPSVQPEEVLTQTPVQYVVVGEGEQSLVELLEHLLGRRPVEAVRGLVYRTEHGLARTAEQEPIADLDALGLPDYGAIDQDRYAAALSYAYTMRRQGLILSSRGCPFHCKYCLKFMGDRYRPRSASSVVGEIEHLQAEHGIRDIMFVDDTFNLDPARVERIFRAVLDRGLTCNFYFPAGLRAERMTPALVDLLVSAGTCWITYAVDTVVPRVQRLAGRVGDPGQAAAIIDHTAGRGIMVGVFFMIGFPTETYAEAMTTLEYVRARRRVTLPYCFAVKYFPGTPLTRLALDLGAIGPEAVEASRLPYHDVSQARTSTLSRQDFDVLFTYYLKDILLERERLSHALDVQERHLSRQEMAAAYSALLGRDIDDPRHAFRHALSPPKETGHG